MRQPRPCVIDGCAGGLEEQKKGFCLLKAAGAAIIVLFRVLQLPFVRAGLQGEGGPVFYLDGRVECGCAVGRDGDAVGDVLALAFPLRADFPVGREVGGFEAFQAVGDVGA